MLCSVHCKSPPSGSLTAAALGELSRRLSVARRALRKQTNEHFYGGWQRLHSKATEQLSHAWCLRDSFYAQRKFIFRFTTTTTTMPDDDASKLYNICIEYVSGMDRRPATCYSPRNAIWFSCRCVDVRRLQFSHSSFIPIYAVIHKSHGSWRLRHRRGAFKCARFIGSVNRIDFDSIGSMRAFSLFYLLMKLKSHFPAAK